MADHLDIEIYIPSTPDSHGRTMSGKEHTPSRYRAIIQESKSGKGRAVGKLVEEARSIPDPYYQALALFGISGSFRRISNGLDFSYRVKTAEGRVFALRVSKGLPSR